MLKGILIALILLVASVSHAAAAAPLRVTIHFRVASRESIERSVADRQDPHSPKFHQWLKTGEFNRRYGRSPEEIAAVVKWLTASGYTICGETNRYIIADGSTPLTIPEDLKGIVSGISDSGHWPHRGAQVSSISGDLQGIGPYDWYRMYNVPSPVANGGVGQCIALIEAGDILSSTTSLFNSTFSLPAATVHLRLDGSNPGRTPDSLETELDVQWAHALAPFATLTIYMGVGTSLVHLIQDAVDDNICPIISISWEEGSEGGDTTLLEPIYAQGAAQGQSIFVISGDFTNGTSLNGLATSPNVTAVGGTTGSLNFPPPDYLIPSKPPEASRYTGGASGVYPKPSWQMGLGVPADGARDIPDVSAFADAGSYLFVDNYDSGTDISFFTIGGTSVAAPAWAGLAALINQRVGERVGNLNPSLYQIANKHLGFYDVTQNTAGVHCSATPGYDLCTGWGTPKFDQLEQAIVQLNSVGRHGGPF